MYERLIWLVPAAVVIAGLWRPRAGLLVLAATLPFFGSPPGGPYLAALDVAALAAIATAWRAGRPEPTSLTWPAAAFVVVSLASLIPSPYQPPGWHLSTLAGLLRALPGVETWSALYTWRAAADLVLGYGLFLALGRAWAGRSVLPLARAFLAGLVAVMALGVAAEAGWVDLGGFRPHHGGLLEQRRLYSVFFLSGWLAEFIVLATPPALAALAAGGRWSRRLVAPVAVAAVACLGLTLQRGGWVAAAAMALFAAGALAWRLRADRGQVRRWALRTGGVVALTAAVLVAAPRTSMMVERGEALLTGFADRLPLWAAAGELAGERPLLGWGLGSFTPAYELLHPRGTPGASPWRNTAHSLYFDVVAERGGIGLVALGLLLATAAVGARRARPGQEALALALTASVIGIAVYGLVQYFFHLRNLQWMVWLLLGGMGLAVRPGTIPWVDRGAKLLIALALVVVPLRIFVGQPAALAGNHEYGLHESEADAAGSSYRWTEGSAALRLPWEGETLVLELANGHPLAASWPVQVEVRVDGALLLVVRPPSGWEEYEIAVGPPRRQRLTLALRARPTFRPFSDFRRHPEIGASTDIRSLGVAMREPRWRTVQTASARPPSPQRASTSSE